MAAPRILAFAGSTREDSYNKKLIKAAAQGSLDAGAEVKLVDLRDYAMPLYDGDLEAKEGLPENAKRLKQLFLSHDGLLIASPEYNSSVSGVLKNTLDWVSRPETKDEPSLAAYAGKTAALLSASTGALGGLRGLVHLRSILGNIKVLVLPEQLSISKASDAFNPDGSMKDPKQQASVHRIAATLAETIHKLKGDKLSK